MSAKKHNLMARFILSSFVSTLALTSVVSAFSSGVIHAFEVSSDRTGSTNTMRSTALIAKPALPTDSRVPGGIAVIPLSTEHKDAHVTFNNKEVWKIKSNDQVWAVIGIPLSQKVGALSYYINGKQLTLEVQDKSYKEQHLTVKKKHANPPSRDMGRITEESRLSQEAFSLFSDINKDKPYSQFQIPAQGPISSPFGLKRFFNEQPRRPHSGLDIAAPRGSDIVAPMAGRIVLTGEFFFNGNSIFIDHGQGLVTMYCHMDSLESKVGQWVNPGDVIGTIGATGRVTGPHLHWTVSLNNVRVDPLLFIESTNDESTNNTPLK